ncbi:MAG TPA: DUF1800 family protein [Dokdonella sp.]
MAGWPPCVACFLLLLLAGGAGAAHAQAAPGHQPDAMLHDGFERIDAGPASDADAARFLAQASFGATSADIAHLRAIGYAAWLDEQFAAPATHALDYLNWVGGTLGEPIYQNARLEAWFVGALGGPDPQDPLRVHTDQLRQRVAFALSEILVVSDKAGTLGNQAYGLAYWQDLLADGAFGNFRDLIGQVTLNPEMGEYLNVLGNRKPDPVLNIRPDENYAREVMQLFTVGLVRLHPDGTPMLSGGQPIATYDQDTVKGFAHVFTGWNWAGCIASNWDYCGPGWPDGTGWLLPMSAVEDYHDEGAQDDQHEGKQLLDYPGVALPGGLLPSGGSAESDMAAALDNLFQHPNVGPFLGRQLIQRLVTSNPTPAYVQRVAQVFDDNGGGVRGDLGAVVRAILLDPEARYGQWSNAEGYGKLREPLLRLTHLWRAMAAQHECGIGTYANLYRYPEWNPESYAGQAPLRSNSVFNFFRPDFAPLGEVSDDGLLAPEFQIATDTLVTSFTNATQGRIFYDYIGSGSCDPNNPYGHVQIDADRDLALAADAGALLDRYDLLLMSGQMSAFMRQTLLDYLLTIDASNSDGARQRVQQALFLILTSPEYVIQK